MQKIPLRIARSRPLDVGKRMHLRSLPPFAINKRGVLVHRPASASVYNIHGYPHLGVKFLCGMSVCDSRKKSKLTFTDALEASALLCLRCELIAEQMMLPAAETITGHHVHKGKVVGMKTCCAQLPDVPTNPSSPEKSICLMENGWPSKIIDNSTAPIGPTTVTYELK